MIGPLLLNYLYNNYSYYVSTPLSKLMYPLIIFIWENKNAEFMSRFNVNSKKLIILTVYSSDFEELFEKLNFEHLTRKKEVYDYLLNIRKDFKIDNFNNENNIYDEELFIYIINNIIKISLKDDLDEIEKEMIKYDETIKKTDISNEIILIFHHYYDYVIKKMIDLEKYIDAEKIKYFQLYKEKIYDPKYNKEELKTYFEEKIDLFKLKTNNELTSIKQKFNSYLYILRRWIDIFDKGEKHLKIYYSKEIFEEINIFQDICSLGDMYLIELASPIINKLSFIEQKNIIQKMSSGVKNRTNHLFSFNPNFESFFNEVWNDNRVEKLKYDMNFDDKNIFEKQFNTIKNTMCDILQKYK